ncbi:MAG: ATP-binding cassette domain-containing protein, partial [Casimicrobium sp.]
LHRATGVLALERASGSVKLSGSELAGLAQTERDRLRPLQGGWMPQRVHLISALNVIDNVLLPFVMGGHASASIETFRARSRELLRDVGVAQYENAVPATLSVGQASRVCAVRALAAMPTLLCADEPSAALDRESAEAIAQAMACYVREGGAALIATHDRDFIEALQSHAESVREIALNVQ